MMVQKRRRDKSRSSNDVMRNRFPNQVGTTREQEGVEDTLVE
jgi:hypothetical protein